MTKGQPGCTLAVRIGLIASTNTSPVFDWSAGKSTPERPQVRAIEKQLGWVLILLLLPGSALDGLLVIFALAFLSILCF